MTLKNCLPDKTLLEKVLDILHMLMFILCTKIGVRSTYHVSYVAMPKGENETDVVFGRVRSRPGAWMTADSISLLERALEKDTGMSVVILTYTRTRSL